MRRNVRGVHGRFPFDRPREERVPEADGERGSNLCELRVLKRKRRWRFGPDEQVRLFHGGGEADSRDFIKFGGVRLKPIYWIGLRLPKIQIHGPVEKMRLAPRPPAPARPPGASFYFPARRGAPGAAEPSPSLCPRRGTELSWGAGPS